LILVPRHPHRFDEVAALLDRSGLRWRRRTEFDATGAKNRSHDWQVLLVDTVGELGAWWGAASIGFVGGSLHSSRGGQNMIEPAAYGVPTCFGPNTQNFRDVVELLLSQNAAVRVNSGEELNGIVRKCLDDAAHRSALGARAAEVVRQQQGATNRTWSLLTMLLSESIEPSRQPLSRKAA
jgi:3-deoxy-D-manno-octulosonic-acid transferase